MNPKERDSASVKEALLYIYYPNNYIGKYFFYLQFIFYRAKLKNAALYV